MNTDPKDEDKEMKWGYAIAGVLAIGIAAVVQFVFGDLDQETQENLPALFAIPYAMGGKLGLTIPLAVIGLILLLCEAFLHGGGSEQTTTSAAPRSAKRTAPAKRAAQQEEEEMEMGEPLSEAVEGEPQPNAVKIPARGRFAGAPRSSGAPRSGGAARSSEEESGVTSDGHMVLSTAKYLGTNGGKPSFRKGKAVMRTDEE
jgi:hypothetical protein